MAPSAQALAGDWWTKRPAMIGSGSQTMPGVALCTHDHDWARRDDEDIAVKQQPAEGA
jgi:hypothetical protein